MCKREREREIERARARERKGESLATRTRPGAVLLTMNSLWDACRSSLNWSVGKRVGFRSTELVCLP